MGHDDLEQRIEEAALLLKNAYSGDFTSWSFTKYPFAKTEYHGQYMFSWKYISVDNVDNDMVIGPKNGVVHEPLNTADKILLTAMQLGHFKHWPYFCPHIKQIERLIISSFKLTHDDLTEMDWPEIMRYVRECALAQGITNNNVYSIAVKTACQDLPQELISLSSQILLNGIKGVQFDRLKSEVYYPIFMVIVFGVNLFREQPDDMLCELVTLVFDTMNYIEKIQEVPRSSAIKRINEFSRSIEKCLFKCSYDTVQKRNLWEDVPPDIRKAIQDFCKESKVLKSEGKRLFIDKFCRERGINESIFRSEKDRIEKRRQRGWAD